MAKKSQKPKARSATRKPSGNLLRAVEIGKRQKAFAPSGSSEVALAGVDLGRALGLKQSGVAIIRVPAGGQSDLPHGAGRDEEWLYILMGQGNARVGGKDFAVGMGDFLAFPAAKLGRQLQNVGFDDLVYLVGGSANAPKALRVRKPNAKR